MEQKLLIVSLLGVLIMNACTTRNDKVFRAFDELYYIILFENENDFEILYNGVNTAKGKYICPGITYLT